jgi:hypothetical protein
MTDHSEDSLFLRRVHLLAIQRNLDKSQLLDAIERALLKAIRTRIGTRTEVKVTIDRATGEIHVADVERLIPTSELRGILPISKRIFVVALKQLRDQIPPAHGQ